MAFALSFALRLLDRSIEVAPVVVERPFTRCPGYLIGDQDRGPQDDRADGGSGRNAGSAKYSGTGQILRGLEASSDVKRIGRDMPEET